MLDVGRICVKTAGRDAGKEGVVLKLLDNNYVLLDGNTRRKKVNISHLEPLNIKVNVKEEASTADVQKAMEGAKISVTKKESSSSESGKKSSSSSKSSASGTKKSSSSSKSSTTKKSTGSAKSSSAKSSSSSTKKSSSSKKE